MTGDLTQEASVVADRIWSRNSLMRGSGEKVLDIEVRMADCGVDGIIEVECVEDEEIEQVLEM